MAVDPQHAAEAGQPPADRGLLGRDAGGDGALAGVQRLHLGLQRRELLAHVLDPLAELVGGLLHGELGAAHLDGEVALAVGEHAAQDGHEEEEEDGDEERPEQLADGVDHVDRVHLASGRASHTRRSRG